MLKFQCPPIDFRVLIAHILSFVNPRGWRATTHIEIVPKLKAKLGEQALAL